MILNNWKKWWQEVEQTLPQSLHRPIATTLLLVRQTSTSSLCHLVPSPARCFPVYQRRFSQTCPAVRRTSPSSLASKAHRTYHLTSNSHSSTLSILRPRLSIRSSTTIQSWRRTRYFTLASSSTPIKRAVHRNLKRRVKRHKFRPRRRMRRLSKSLI